MDIYTKTKRSEIMAKIGQKNTSPELIVRKIIYYHGFRYRLHVKRLAGCPDIVFPRLKKLIFVHGCFWHGHSKCKRAYLPATNKNFWEKKITQNKKRDNANLRKLHLQGWYVLTVWQCQLITHSLLEKKILKFLRS